MSFLFGCFKSKDAKEGAKRTIQNLPPDKAERLQQAGKNGRVLPHFGTEQEGDKSATTSSCARCGRPMQTGQHSRSNSMGGQNNMSAAAANDKTKDQQDYLTVNGSDRKDLNVRPQTTNEKQEGAETVINHAINEQEGDQKPNVGTVQHLNQLCMTCRKKESGANMDMMSNGSHRDDVSVSTMAARSSKTYAESNTTNGGRGGFGGETNATMTTINGSQRSQVFEPLMTPQEARKNKQLIEQYKAMRFKKYYFLPPEPFTNQELIKDQSDARKQTELNLYNRLKNHDRIVFIDGAPTYFLIATTWMDKWKDFVQGYGKYPGPIVNIDLATKIQNQRAFATGDLYKAHDNPICIKERETCFVLCKEFFDMYASRYDIDIVIQCRKYDHAKQIIGDPLEVGPSWSVMRPQLEGHFEPMKAKIFQPGNTLEQRHKLESGAVDHLQNGDKAWCRYYALNTQWIQKWLNWVQKPVDQKTMDGHPGPVNNDQIIDKLISKEDDDLVSQRQDYYNVSKHLFYFFISIYGGGPCLVANKLWEQNEPIYCQTPQNEPQEESKGPLSNRSRTTQRYERQYANSKREEQREPDPMVRNYRIAPDFADGIVGLENNTFYCYMNACLQCLLPITELRDHYVMQNYFNVAERGRTRTRNQFDFCHKLHELYSVVYHKSSQQKSWIIKPTLKQLLRRRFDPIMQHDSHEFMVYLLEQLQDEETLVNRPKFDGSDDKKTVQQICSEFSRSYNTVIDRIFSGIMQTIVKCGKCRYESATYNPFMTQSLQHKASLVKCLQEYYTENSLDDYYTCESCHKKTKAKVRHNLVKLPKVLVFHIKRFDSNFRKIEKSTTYTEMLDMSPFCKSDVSASLRGSTHYRLYALTVHHGNLSGGHYVAYARRGDNYWYHFNDEHFDRIKTADALKKQAYLLFYEQVE